MGSHHTGPPTGSLGIGLADEVLQINQRLHVGSLARRLPNQRVRVAVQERPLVVSDGSVGDTGVLAELHSKRVVMYFCIADHILVPKVLHRNTLAQLKSRDRGTEELQSVHKNNARSVVGALNRDNDVFDEPGCMLQDLSSKVRARHVGQNLVDAAKTLSTSNGVRRRIWRALREQKKDTQGAEDDGEVRTRRHHILICPLSTRR